ncbi:hypothetical protein MRX96_003109 [Rhipicephalus microplus]
MSSPRVPIPFMRVPTHPSSGHPSWPPPPYSEDFFHQSPTVSTLTPPKHYTQRVTTNHARSSHIAHRGSPVTSATDWTRDHQHLLAMDTYPMPHRDASVNSLQYCMIGVLFAGLFVAAALVVIDSPGGRLSPYDIVQPEEENSHPAHYSPPGPAYDIRDEKDAEVVLPGQDEQHSLGVQASAANILFRKPDGTATTSTVTNGDDEAQEARPISLRAPMKRRRQDCSRYYYTYCTRPTTTVFHYDPEELTCVPTTALGTQLCNRGTNRFSSWQRCRAGCLQPDRVSDMCFENALFMPCSKQDVIASFWYFNGTACTKWTFPHGRCPARQPGIYRTLGECSLQCVENGGQADSLRCGVPAPGECELEHLRYPYFADMQAEGSARCVNSSHATLLGRRCLIGINQFDSIKACQWACQG